ncbi:MAG: tRNA-binding protein [Candidatus Microthrix sp.]|nr:tRNA-binding protein [Candidatus Microthrix sp.]MBP6151341.1 tRNA-binding protein [Candidatus Microthrix sp.]MBP7405996.1 tRNA-binding protein [Candidatus Microthrix sp.]MBP7852897.1 tRNA-binding protein [Candidatus Microthrix sp.]MBP7879575.1 tRNA-binding protein [Candidatus Microthrix sp.]
MPRQPQRKHPVSAEVFASIDMRVGVVQDVEAFPEARKPAWKLRVDFGPGIGVLQTSAQITNYAADALLGRRVVGVINLGTRRIAGFRSEFLVLGAVEADGSVLLLAPDGESAVGRPIA